MQVILSHIFPWLQSHPWIYAIFTLSILFILVFLITFVLRYVLKKILAFIFRNIAKEQQNLKILHKLANRITNIIAISTIYIGLYLLDFSPPTLFKVISFVCQALIIFTLALIVSNTLTIINNMYMRKENAANKPIKSFLELIEIIIFVVCALLILGILLDKDIFTLLAGLGAMIAIVMLIFQSTILSFVASVQVASYDMVRIGDWIEMPALNANGHVIDISLHTIKVQNWDKTITTIPTSRLITDTFINWRGMFESGGRRIKRQILIDQNSMHFITPEEFKHLNSFELLKGYFENKTEEITQWNQELNQKGITESINYRRLTNLGTFRAYVLQYLNYHPHINKQMTLLVRLLEPSNVGIPLEVYCFTNRTEWAIYEGIQSDIFDHLLSTLPEFGLRVFQEPTGLDLQKINKVN